MWDRGCVCRCGGGSRRKQSYNKTLMNAEYVCQRIKGRGWSACVGVGVCGGITVTIRRSSTLNTFVNKLQELSQGKCIQTKR